MGTLPKSIQSMRKEVPKQSNIFLPSLRRAFCLYDQINLIDNVPEDQLRFSKNSSQPSLQFQRLCKSLPFRYTPGSSYNKSLYPPSGSHTSCQKATKLLSSYRTYLSKSFKAVSDT